MSTKKTKTTRREFTQEQKDEHVRRLAAWVAAGGTLKGYASGAHIAESVLRRWRDLGTAPKAQSVQTAKARKTHATPYTREQKLAAVAEIESGQSTAIDVAARMGVTVSGVSYWRKTLGNGARANRKALIVGEVVNGKESSHVAQTHAMRDATIFLRKAKHELLDGIRAGNIDDLDSSHLLSLLALKALTGGA